jgi:hypothetical protein
MCAISLNYFRLLVKGICNVDNIIAGGLAANIF